MSLIPTIAPTPDSYFVVGVDEVGRGPLAGPVCAAAVVLPQGFSSSEINDSKQLSAPKREYLSELIQQEAVAWAVVSVGHRRIGTINIRNATKLAMSLAVRRVVSRCQSKVGAIGLVRIDGNMLIDTNLRQETVIGGDAKHLEIAAASILAKVYRDRLMQVLDLKYPGYRLGRHAGYPTSEHRAAIAALGPSKVHRATFRGVKEHLRAREVST
jgi:ribonuclease HII